jgi:hypothetical protein
MGFNLESELSSASETIQVNLALLMRKMAHSAIDA